MFLRYKRMIIFSIVFSNALNCCELCSYFYKQRGRAKDPVAYLHDVEQRARERQVAYETVRILRQRVRWNSPYNGIGY